MAYINSQVLRQARLQLGININIPVGKSGDIEQGLAKFLPDAPAREEWLLVYLPRSDHRDGTVYPRPLRRLCTVRYSFLYRRQRWIGHHEAANKKERSP